MQFVVLYSIKIWRILTLKQTCFSREDIITWLSTPDKSEIIARKHYQGTQCNYRMDELFGLANDFESSTDLRSISEISELSEDGYKFTETDWIHPFSSLSIHKHPRYFPPFDHYHYFFEICYVIDGFCEHIINPKAEAHPLTLHSGDFLVIPPGTHHMITMNSDSTIVNILIRKTNFEQVFLRNIPENSVLYQFFVNALYTQSSKRYILFRSNNDLSIKEIFYNMAVEYCNNQLYSNTLVNQYLSIIFTILLQKHNQSIEFSNDSSHTHSLIPAVVQYIEYHYAHTSIEDIAQHFNINASYLGKVFKEKTEHKLIDTLINTRIESAKKILSSTSISIEHVSELVGYNDTTHFIRVFKRKTGKTPLQYRKYTWQNQRSVSHR